MELKKLIKKRSAREYILWCAIIAVGILLDQITKMLAVKYLLPIRPDSVPIFEGVLQLTYVENTGAAFGSFKGMPWIFNTISVIAICAMSAYLFLGHSEGRLQPIAFALIISGGIGNMIDRILLGYVIDFIDFCLINFAVFNGADSFVCVGAGLLILTLVLELIAEVKKERAARSGGSDGGEE